MVFQAWLRAGLFLLLTLSLLLGCGGKGVKSSEGDPEALYRQGLIRFNKRDYPEALKRFQELKANFPDRPPFSVWAELKVADCHFFMKEYVEAIAAYEEFKKIHPTHEEIPYVQYQIAMSYFKQMPSYDRDQTATKKALSNFEYLIANYPPSLFTEKAKEKIEICKRQLAAHEFYVGKYYHKQRNYQAASRRLEQLLATFPTMANEEEALFLLGTSLLQLNQHEKAFTVLSRLVSEYPNGQRSRKAMELMELKLTVGEREKKNPKALEPEALPFTKYEEEKRVSLPVEPPLTLPIRKINPHPRVELELEFVPEEEGRLVRPPAPADPPQLKEGKRGASAFGGKAEWEGGRTPIDIVSDQVETDTRGSRVLFRGNVFARQEDVAIYADSIEVITRGQEKGIEKVMARGHVRIQQGMRVATCEQAVFDQVAQTISLIGDPRVSEGGSWVAGEEIIVHLAENRVEVKGGPSRRGKATLYPDKRFEKLK